MRCTCVCTCGAKINKPLTNRFWDRQKIVAAIVALRKDRIPVNYTSLETDRSPRSYRVLKETLGREIRPRAVYQAASRLKFSWPQLLAEAGVRDVSAYATKNFWTEELILRLVKGLNSRGYPINNSAVRFRMSTNAREYLKKEAGVSLTGTALYRAGQEYFGSWTKCLNAAGLQSNTVRQKRISRRKSTLPLLELHKERVQHHDGRSVVLGFHSASPKTPEEALFEESRLIQLAKFLSQLPKQDRKLLENVIDSLEDGDLTALILDANSDCSQTTGSRDQNKTVELIRKLKTAMEHF